MCPARIERLVDPVAGAEEGVESAHDMASTMLASSSLSVAAPGERLVGSGCCCSCWFGLLLGPNDPLAIYMVEQKRILEEDNGKKQQP